MVLHCGIKFHCGSRLGEESDIKIDKLVYVGWLATVMTACVCSRDGDGQSEPASEAGSFQLDEDVPLVCRLAALLSSASHVNQQAELLDAVQRTCSQRLVDGRPYTIRVDVQLEVTERHRGVVEEVNEP